MNSSTPRQTKDRATPAAFLIVRVSAIGDVLMASPLAQALREAYPDAHIAWAVEPLAAPLVRANPYVDEVILMQTAQWETLWRQKKFLALWRRIAAFARELRRHRFDAVVDCQGLLKSGLLSRLTNAPRRIGPLPSQEGNHLFMTERASWEKLPTHLSDRYLMLLEPLGIPPKPRRPILQVPEADRLAAREFLESQGLTYDRYVACCISSTRPQKDWVWERWGELADLLWQRDGLRTVFIGGPERKADAHRLSEQYASHPISAVGNVSLLASAALVQGAVGVAGVDTGLTYAGMAVDTPTVTLYGSTESYWLREEPHTIVLKHEKPCSPCNRHPSCANYDCMRAITVTEVADALRDLMARKFTVA